MISAMNLLMVIPVLATGGAEWAVVRQANALVEAGCCVTCYVPFVCDSATALIEAVDSRVQLVSLPSMNSLRRRVLYKLSQVLPFDLEQMLHSSTMRRLHRRENFDAINPHLNSGTMMVCRAFRHTAVPIIETDHGDYALILKEDPSLERLRLPLERLDGMICPSRANHDRIAKLPWADRFRSTVIPYSYPITQQPVPRAVPDDNVFTFGMISRGVPEKGWREAIAAYLLVRERTSQPTRLVLAGGGEHLSALARDLDESFRPHVFFAGAQPDPRPWIESFDVALLPSYFTAESLPNVIIEALAQRKPVVATNIGGISDMITSEGSVCGIVVPVKGSPPRADVAAMADAMVRLLEDETLHTQYSEAAQRAAQRYLPSTCAPVLIEFLQSFQIKQPTVSKTRLP
jgi:L-malate glycosyltransferase